MIEKICPTCLSRDRNLVYLNIDKYAAVFGDQTMMKINSVCWECLKMFHKLHKFKLQVLKAQECLTRSSRKINLTPLTNLTCSSINLYDICCDQNIKHMFQDDRQQRSIIKTDISVPNIKSENEVCEDKDIINQDVFVNNYLISIEGVKCDEAILNGDMIKQENDDISNDEIIVRELCVNTLQTKVAKIRKAQKKVPKTRKAHTSKLSQLQNSIRRKHKVHIEKKKADRNDKKSKLVIVTKDNYIITEMTEEEMQAKRERDRQADRFKNKVKYRCDLCIVGFFHKVLYENHMRTRHSEKAGRHLCIICETRFAKLNYYKEHVVSHYRRYQCKSCSFVGHKLSEMVSHDAREHDIRRFTCRVCGVQFPSPSSLRFHRETTHEAPLKCETCAKLFKTKNGLRVHAQQMHSFKPKTPCTVCGARVRHIKSHMRKHRAVPEAAYCAECDKRFTSTASYKSHLKYSAPHRAPDTVLRHVCKICDAKFVNSTGLKKHTQARHSNVRPFKCDQCGKGFEAQCKLKLHITHGHEGVEKPKNKICHICGRGFNTKFMLSNHIRVHTGEKPFRCEICGAAFSQKSSLTTHTRGVHLKIRPRPGRGITPRI